MGEDARRAHDLGAGLGQSDRTRDYRQVGTAQAQGSTPAGDVLDDIEGNSRARRRTRSMTEAA
jgi:hypothetical protein